MAFRRKNSPIERMSFHYSYYPTRHRLGVLKSTTDIKAKEQHGHGPIHIEAFDFLGLAVHERKIRGIKYIPCFNIEMGL